MSPKNLSFLLYPENKTKSIMKKWHNTRKNSLTFLRKLINILNRSKFLKIDIKLYCLIFIYGINILRCIRNISRLLSAKPIFKSN